MDLRIFATVTAALLCVVAGVGILHLIRGGPKPPQTPSPTEIDTLREEVRQLREDIEPQIVELTERLDFAERLLANVPRTPQSGRPVTTPV